MHLMLPAKTPAAACAGCKAGFEILVTPTPAKCYTLWLIKFLSLLVITTRGGIERANTNAGGAFYN